MELFKGKRTPGKTNFVLFLRILLVLGTVTITPVVSAAVLGPVTTGAEGQAAAPKFLSKGGIYRAVTGDSLSLPCHIDNPGNFIILWRRGANVLTAANIIVSRDTRYTLDGNNLVISRVEPHDAGDYVCQISDHVNRDLIHTVEIMLPPTLRMVPSSGQLTVKQGGSVSMECKGSGNPVPSITWSKKTHHYKKLVDGAVLTLDRIRMEDAGIYQCTAENGVGKPVSLDMKLDVLFPPNVTIEKSLVHSSENFDAQLACIVLAEPQATVLWFRNSFSIQPTDRHLMTSRNGRHMLQIKNLQAEDFGNYSCMAENTLGRMKKFIEISGRPKPAEIISQPWSKYTDSYELAWKVQSFPPIMEVRVMYRKLLMNETYQQPGRWHDIILTETANSRINNADASERIMSHILNGLEASSIYEAIVQAKNRYGWSEVSDIYQFYTQRHSMEPRVEGVEQMLSSIFRGNSATRVSAGGLPLVAVCGAMAALVLQLLRSVDDLEWSSRT